MRIKSRCFKCQKAYEKLVPEGTTSVPWKCECGARWVDLTIYPPWVRIFGQGIRLFNELDYRMACNEFASAFEVFQKEIVLYSLQEAKTRPALIDWLSAQRFDRQELATLMSTLLGTTVSYPSARVRNAGYHTGKVPTLSEAEDFANSVLLRMRQIVTVFIGGSASKLKRVIQQRNAAGPLPHMPPELRRRYDLEVAISDLESYWKNKLAIGAG